MATEHTELYIKDTLSDRWAIEAKRMIALGIVKPCGIGLRVDLEERIQKADGFSSKHELLAELDKQVITYFPQIGNPNYDFKILAPTDKVDDIIKLAKKSGYIQVKPAENYACNT